MAHHRIALILALSFSSGHLWATGDYYEETIPTLPVLMQLDRLPAKGVADILPGPKRKTPTPKKFDYSRELKGIETGLAKQKPAEFLPLLDEMTVSARFGDTGISSLLIDLRDLFSTPDATPNECAEYLRWRLTWTEAFRISWDGRQYYSPDPTFPDAAAGIDAHIAKASPSLLPHWLYLRGALLFKNGDDEKSDLWFERILERHAKHPRAQAALFMHARCLLSQSRSYKDVPDGARYSSNEKLRNEAKNAFSKYLSRYPKGYFAGDAIGWLGAVAYDAGDYPEALTQYLKQLTLQDHPEFERSASEMCELALSRIASEPDDAVFTKIAKDPVLAQALVYLIVDSLEADNFNGHLDEVQEVVTWRRSILPRVAAAVVRNKGHYRDAIWQPRYLSILGLASSGAGKQAEALQLVESAPALLKTSDDLAFTRAVILQRGLKTPEACQAYHEFLTRFPNSPLANAVPLRLAMAHIDNHEAGLALVVLDQWLAKQPRKTDENQSLEWFARNPMDPPLEAQARQIIDNILNFSPIAEIQPALEKDRLLPETAVFVKGALAQRLLAHENFQEAKKFMTPAQWGLAAAEVEKLALSANAAKAESSPEAKAAAYLILADAWAKHRGHILTAPLDSSDYRGKVFLSDSAKANTNRIANAAVLPGKIKAGWEMENRDELRHAFNWWLEASDITQNPKLKAAAIYRALMAMPAIADVSTFTLENAKRRNWTAVSRKLYDRLKKECPDSTEAQKLAVYWDFTVPEDDSRQTSTYSNSPSLFNGVDIESEYFGIKDPLEFAKDAKVLDAKAFRDKVEKFATEARREAKGLGDQFVVNFLDDLALFTAEPDPGMDARQLYVELRTDILRTSALDHNFPMDNAVPDRSDTDPVSGRSTFDDKLRQRIAKALQDPKMAPVKDYVAFLDIAVVANHWVFIPFPGGPQKDGEKETYWGRDYVLLSKMAGEFLQQYPKSKKREAALLLYARGTYRSMKPLTQTVYADWPASPRWDGSMNEIALRRMPLSAKKLNEILDTYDREFPNGRYAAEIQSFRTGLALMELDWDRALSGLLDRLGDDDHPWLQPEASDLLWELFTTIKEDQHRFDILAAVKKYPAAKARLEEFIEKLDTSHPLYFMRKYLTDQLEDEK